jgi:hypothetical protein
MSDLISRADAIEAVRSSEFIFDSPQDGFIKHDVSGMVRAVLLEVLEALPSADAVQGEWIVREYCTNELDYRRWIEIECPFCGERPTYENLDNMNYCPNCGARMTPYKGGDTE